MRKVITVALLFFAVCFSAQAQSFKLGIKAGVDMNKITGEPFSKQFTYGYQAGVFSEIGITPKFGIQPEVIFSQVNVDTANSFKDVTGFQNLDKVKLQYLKIPVLFTYKPNPFVVFQAGPQFGKLIDKNKNIAQNGRSVFANGDLGLTAGLQVNILKIRVYGRYAIGLKNLNDTGSPEKWTSRNVQLGLGFAL